MNKEVRNLIIRTLVLVIVWINMILVNKGISPLPIDENGATELISEAMAALATLWAWWKDNDVTKKARAKKEVIATLEHEGEI
ncbi:phage holin [Clostridiales Family XIII bacterium ASD5510]|uniref:Phage holin n=1 Tax=Hominibacterium faecale TaxID=2839743 RepID=A0A9J6R005_9FIRM|nr:phage holin [Hominibacterium faecale]MCU7381064.1 phage holin [Hominibacterium faecale]